PAARSEAKESKTTRRPLALMIGLDERELAPDRVPSDLLSKVTAPVRRSRANIWATLPDAWGQSSVESLRNTTNCASTLMAGIVRVGVGIQAGQHTCASRPLVRDVIRVEDDHLCDVGTGFSSFPEQVPSGCTDAGQPAEIRDWDRDPRISTME